MVPNIGGQNTFLELLVPCCVEHSPDPNAVAPPMISRSVASAFGLMPTDLPAVVAFSGKRMRYAALPKVSDAQAIMSFIDGVLGGSIRTNVLDVSVIVL